MSAEGGVPGGVDYGLPTGQDQVVVRPTLSKCLCAHPSQRHTPVDAPRLLSGETFKNI